ncbi:MAG: DNA-binding protein [Bacteroidota bacterium]
MQLKAQIDRLKRIDALIQRKATGCPKRFSSRLGISKASLHRYIEHLKDFGAPIAYCRTRETYYYETHFELKF